MVKPPFEDRGSSYQTDFGYLNVVIPVFFDGLSNPNVISRLKEAGREDFIQLYNSL